MKLSKADKALLLELFTAKKWKEYNQLLKQFGVDGLVRGPETKGIHKYNNSKKGREVRQLDPNKFEHGCYYKIQPLRYLKKKELGRRVKIMKDYVTKEELIIAIGLQLKDKVEKDNIPEIVDWLFDRFILTPKGD